MNKFTDIMSKARKIAKSIEERHNTRFYEEIPHFAGEITKLRLEVILSSDGLDRLDIMALLSVLDGLERALSATKPSR